MPNTSIVVAFDRRRCIRQQAAINAPARPIPELEKNGIFVIFFHLIRIEGMLVSRHQRQHIAAGSFNRVTRAYSIWLIYHLSTYGFIVI